MQSLNLRGGTPVSEEPTEEPTGTPPEEPLGLAAIRAWLAKPRPRLYRLWLWAPLTAAVIRNACAWLRATTGPALRHAAKTARKAGKAIQALRGITRRLADWFRKAFPPGSRGRAFAVHLIEANRQFGVAALALLGLGRELDRASPRPPPAQRPGEPPGSPAPPSPDRTEEQHRTEEPDRAEEQHPARQRTPREDAAPSPGRMLPRPSRRRGEQPLRKGRPAPETPPPAPADAQPASDGREGPRAKALADLPNSLRVAILSLGKRPRKRALRFVIWRIVDETGPASSERLGRLLDMDSANLTKRHLGPLVEAGALERTIPDRPNHPDQAYRPTGGPPG